MKLLRLSVNRGGSIKLEWEEPFLVESDLKEGGSGVLPPGNFLVLDIEIYAF